MNLASTGDGTSMLNSVEFPVSPCHIIPLRHFPLLAPVGTPLKEHSHDFTYRAQMIVLNVYNATIDDLRRCTFFGRQ